MSNISRSREPGKIILLNGASSSGKTTLALAIQELAQAPFIHFSFDHLRDSNALPMAKIQSQRVDWSQMRPAVFDGFHRCLPALAGAGNNLLVDHIIETEAWLQDLVRLLAPFDVFFVGVHCPPEELERRERARGNRRPGEALADYASVHQFTVYDLEIDTTAPGTDNAQRVLKAWRERVKPSALERLAIQRD